MGSSGECRDRDRKRSGYGSFPSGREVRLCAIVGRRGLHLQRESNINQPTPDVVAANPGVNLDALRPYTRIQLNPRN